MRTTADQAGGQGTDRGRVKRKYDTPQTPYQRVMESDRIDARAKEGLGGIYRSLNPAELKRAITKKLDAPYCMYCAKAESGTIHPLKKQSPRLATKYVAQPSQVRLHLKIA